MRGAAVPRLYASCPAGDWRRNSEIAQMQGSRERPG